MRTGRHRMPAAAVLAPAAFIVADLLIYWSGFEVVWKLGIVLVIGYVLIGISMAFDKDRPPLDWKSAVWLPVWLLGLGVISWQGQFPLPSVPKALPPTNAFNIPFWWDIVIVAAFSLIIYYWAMATKLVREDMMKLVEAQAEEPTAGQRLLSQDGPWRHIPRSGPTRPCGPSGCPIPEPGWGIRGTTGWSAGSGYHLSCGDSATAPGLQSEQGQLHRTGGCPPRRHTGCQTPATSHVRRAAQRA